MNISKIFIAYALFVSVIGSVQGQALLSVRAASPVAPTSAPANEPLRAAGFALESRGPGHAPNIGSIVLVITSVDAPPPQGGRIALSNGQPGTDDLRASNRPAPMRRLAGTLRVGTGTFPLAQVQMAMRPDDRSVMFPATPWVGEWKTQPRAGGAVHVTAVVVTPGGPVGRLSVVLHALDGRPVVTGELALGGRAFAVLANGMP